MLCDLSDDKEEPGHVTSLIYRICNGLSLSLDSLEPPSRKGSYIVLCPPRALGIPKPSCPLKVLVRPGLDSRARLGIAGPLAAIPLPKGESSRLSPSLPLPFAPLPLPTTKPTAKPTGPLFLLEPFHHPTTPRHANPSAIHTAFTISLRSTASRTARQVPRRGAGWCWR